MAEAVQVTGDPATWEAMSQPDPDTPPTVVYVVMAHYASGFCSGVFSTMEQALASAGANPALGYEVVPRGLDGGVLLPQRPG